MRAVAVRGRAVRDVGIVVHGVAPHDIPDRVAQEHVVVRARAEYLRVGIHSRVYDRDDHGLKLGKVVFRTQPRKDDARLREVEVIFGKVPVPVPARGGVISVGKRARRICRSVRRKQREKAAKEQCRTQ